MKDEIIIKDWTGRILFQGNYKDKKVDEVLDANRCPHCELYNENEHPCPHCDDTGYTGEFEVYWTNEDDTRNVYEYINY